MLRAADRYAYILVVEALLVAIFLRDEQILIDIRETLSVEYLSRTI
jgi:hypothetical protein